MIPKMKIAGAKSTTSNIDTTLHEDEAERKRFSEVVEKRMKSDDVMSRRAARISKEKEISKSRGVIYIGHLPHGFYEDQLRKYFSQFGEVTRVRVSRSRKTGGSRGYAFVEFLHDSAAKVAAETMDNYLMYERLLKCSLVPMEKVHPDLFSPRFPFPLNREITRTFINMERTETRGNRNQELRLARLQQQMESLKNLGIKYKVTPVGTDVKQITKSEKSSKVKTKKPKNQNLSTAEKISSDDEQHILLVDSEDNEIEFKTPPHAVRRLKAHPKSVRVTKLLEKSIIKKPKKHKSAIN
ncbi:MKI67 FHA domain-interacting nucleolar phosphoprotein-like [Tropilaelaps mercedesae]|uniref:MKI67 FHA domain-interacting nucleolar phosphoprotein-like n=1 Tax=Tropilaelaps mercedesae TaxID=418985 RepID=A0A1V9XWQ4_9ACAR|nr:MKI67 FHA domain-interacting nucleolar phosphoprotein-like [Tropilaelaps mercedesae]